MEQKTESNLKWLGKLSRDYHKELDLELAPLRLNATNYYFIMKIHDHGGLPQEKLIILTGLNGSNVTRTTQKLIDLGFVLKEKNDHDRRGFLLELTEEGNAVYAEIIESVARAQSKFLSLLTSAEQETFEKLLGKLAESE
ncbi:MarR family winged helix-turn-helix transcriptional regulator [uncultured Enterococcus sp.]|uniref:MarR family winged helix-turn-helix transcriptional regulator n=1 Tax=uncultured Enterococcus sp. TaxID=167972 RepID=UPI0025845042|nr:MarR family transcriptional regulator [uncultured Enterococcus sp.]